MKKQELELTRSEHEIILTCIYRAISPTFPQKKWGQGKVLQKKIWDLYQAFGGALGEEDIKLTWTEDKS